MIQDVATRALEAFLDQDALIESAIQISTPLPDLVSLDACKGLSPTLLDFLIRYEPKIQESGLYDHQAELIKRLDKEPAGVVLTSTTGTGKSLCFWYWVFRCLTRESGSTALLCFPTQALLWSQASRIASVSEPDSLIQIGDVAFGGIVRIGHRMIPWSVWKGSGFGPTVDAAMKTHENSEHFASSRVLLSTLDKAHFSLVRGTRGFCGKEFLSRLVAIVLDEAHVYHGAFGSNVHYFLKRLQLACDLLRPDSPRLFLASATLPNAIEFAASLTGQPQSQFLHVADSVTPGLASLNVLDLPDAIGAEHGERLTRYLMLVNAGANPLDTVLGNPSVIGSDVNAIYFSPSKFDSREFRIALNARVPQRTHVIYDADLPPRERRCVESQLNMTKTKGTTVLATCAMELGVDIEGLDVCVMDLVPNRRSALLQRIGRVGRRSGTPGLAILSIPSGQLMSEVLEDPIRAFQFSELPRLTIPSDVEMIKWRHMLAVESEWNAYEREERGIALETLNRLTRDHFGEFQEWDGLKQRFGQKYGDVVDLANKYWPHQGFRAISNDAKIPLTECAGLDGDKPMPVIKDGERQDVAWIEDTQVFRDAHPEAVYLSHRGQRWRVVGYNVGFASDGRKAPLPTMIFVRRESKSIFTRGVWQDTLTPRRPIDLGKAEDKPRVGILEFSSWEYQKKWDGYLEYSLPRKFQKRVTLAEVSERFTQARNAGTRFPFLKPLTYATQGWQWQLPSDPSLDMSMISGEEIGHLLRVFLTGIVEASPSDLIVEFESHPPAIRVVDAGRGGNGVSRSLLQSNRVVEALKHATRVTTDAQAKNRPEQTEIAPGLVVQDKAKLAALTDSLQHIMKCWA